MATRNVVISCFAFANIPAEVRFDSPPVVILWPGRPKPRGHPTWRENAAALRQRDTQRRLLPPLINSYRKATGVAWDVPGFDRPGRIATIGFSAGFDGVRELIRNDLDAAAIDFVGLIDTPHARMFKGAPYPPDIEPFSVFASRAALGISATSNGAGPPSPGYVATWGDIRTSPAVASAKQTNEAIFREVLARSVPGIPPDVPPGIFAPHTIGGAPAPRPDQIWGRGSAVGLHYPGRDARSHIVQGQKVQVDVWRFFLARRWNVPGASLSQATPPLRFRLPHPDAYAGGFRRALVAGRGRVLGSGLV